MINTKKAYTYFRNNWLIGKPSPKGWHAFNCPYCGKDKKQAVNFSKEICKCWACGVRERIVDFVMNVESLTYREAKVFLESFQEEDIDFTLFDKIHYEKKSLITLPEGYHSILDGEGLLAKRARNYLLARNLDLDYLDKLGFGYCDKENPDYNKDYFGRIIIPFKKKGLLTYFEGRSYIGDGLRYKNPREEEIGVGKSDVLFNESALDLYDNVYTNEGTFDAVTLVNAVATKGKYFSDYQRTVIIKSSCEEIDICLDAGEDKEALRMAFELVDHKKIKIIKLDGKDPNEMGRDRVEAIRVNSPYLSFSDLLDLSEDLK